MCYAHNTFSRAVCFIDAWPPSFAGGKCAQGSQADMGAPEGAMSEQLSKQALDIQAEDLTMEDTLHALEKAMQAGSLTPDV